jgi:hypothetical protein
MGHATAVMCQIGKYDAVWLRNRITKGLTGRSFPRAFYGGGVAYRGYDHSSALSEVLADFCPDGSVITRGSDESFEFGKQGARTWLPTVFHLHDLATLRRCETPTVLSAFS